ncbi:hypothetical protein Q5H92_20225 [Hymenobacter sp. M29]|uniref:Uncharacterized protein n=1 Tax=Hymenobacter mellowenesis TaxID=3063995 RepID=A0ABT9AH95_9BACT|nr:hypothetical protein [Hymenobacter sp. M29]MDO7848704.1 hypothetical protein [Hymenobacter sp. M29]
MSTQLVLIADERGFTVQQSTTHETQAGALAHFTDVLASLHFEHHATTTATSGHALTPHQPAATELPHRWEGPGHQGQPIPSETASSADAALLLPRYPPREEPPF